MKLADQHWKVVQPLLTSLRGGFEAWGGLLLILLAAVGGRIYQGAPVIDPPGNSISENPVVISYAQVVDLIDEYHVKSILWEDLTEKAINRMLHTLDPHSGFYKRSDFTEMMNEQNSRYNGIGAGVVQRNGRLYIVEVIPGMPADRAGMRYWDQIVRVNDGSVLTLNETDLITRVRGERDEPVAITIERAATTRQQTFRIERNEVPYQSVRYSFLIRPGIGYINLSGGFNQETSNELRRAIVALQEQGMERLLLDLRRNPGGLLMQAIQVSEIFLAPGKEIVSIRGREEEFSRRSLVSENQRPERMPLALLIDKGTASASEIFAGALQDQGRARIFGEQSFGKGLIQTVYRLRSGTGLVLTTAKYFTPQGRSIQRSYKDVSLYDYELSSLERSSTTRPLSTPPLRRESVATGGISPDQVVRNEEVVISLRDACFQFARQAGAGLIPDLVEWEIRKSSADQRLPSQDYQVTGLVRRRFREFVQKHPEWQITSALLESRWEYVDRQIRAEMISAAQGIATAEQYLLKSDRQVLRAIDWLTRQRIVK